MRICPRVKRERTLSTVLRVEPRSAVLAPEPVEDGRKARSPLPSELRGANVLQPPTVPALSPVMNQRWRCSEVPWVKLSGTT